MLGDKFFCEQYLFHMTIKVLKFQKNSGGVIYSYNLILTEIFEKIVPVKKYTILGSLCKILLGEFTTQTVVRIKKVSSGTRGRTASLKLLICPVRSLYDT